MPYTGKLVPFVNVDTSEAAAESQGSKAESDRERIFNAFKAVYPGGYTSDEIEAMFHMLHQTASARVRDLVLAGRVERTGDRRLTRTGRSAYVIRYPPPSKKKEDDQWFLF